MCKYGIYIVKYFVNNALDLSVIVYHEFQFIPEYLSPVYPSPLKLLKSSLILQEASRSCDTQNVDGGAWGKNPVASRDERNVSSYNKRFQKDLGKNLKENNI